MMFPKQVPLFVFLQLFRPRILNCIHQSCLDTEPSCEDADCTALVVMTQSEAPPLWPFIGVNPFDTVDLADGVRAHFYERDGMASWQWVQDDAFYMLTYSQEHFSREEAIAMATSMATEPPFTP